MCPSTTRKFKASFLFLFFLRRGGDDGRQEKCGKRTPERGDLVQRRSLRRPMEGPSPRWLRQTGANFAVAYASSARLLDLAVPFKTNQPAEGVLFSLLESTSRSILSFVSLLSFAGVFRLKSANRKRWPLFPLIANPLIYWSILLIFLFDFGRGFALKSTTNKQGPLACPRPLEIRACLAIDGDRPHA